MARSLFVIGGRVSGRHWVVDRVPGSRASKASLLRTLRLTLLPFGGGSASSLPP